MEKKISQNEEPIRLVVAKNLSELRKSKGLTQGELAKKLSYSDKSISKWEHGESIPDIEVLKRLCDFYGVTLDYLVHEGEQKQKMKEFRAHSGKESNKIVITLLSISVAWILAAAIFVGILTIDVANLGHYFHASWLAFVWAVPVSFIIAIIFYGIWGKRRWNSLLVSCLVWTLIASIYLTIGVAVPGNDGWRFWPLFLVGVPLTIAAILWNYRITSAAKKSE